MKQTGTYKIKPAGRHVLTIGRDLIQDVQAAVLELVKNAYDADSPDVEISFIQTGLQPAYTITITDHGHGMSRHDVIHKWLVPSTTDKLERPLSPSGRIMQGRKGVGRYATSVLGSDLFLQTISQRGEQTDVYVQWQDFANATYLEDVDILVDTAPTTKPSGTTLTITGNSLQLNEWNARQFEKLEFELKKLKSPFASDPEVEEFQIKLQIKGFDTTSDKDEIIEPYPIFDLFDYRIAGIVGSEGTGDLQYSNQKIRNSIDETITFDYRKPTGCGQLLFDLRVYDRDKQSITGLINRGLTDNQGNYLGNLQARQLLNQYNGVGVYRNGFRLRPLGDPGNDWLDLNENRFQNPSLRISSNQVIGVVHIQSEQNSHLVEKSARDGLREDEAFNNLKNIIHLVINELEQRRFQHRRLTGMTRTVVKVENQLDLLFSSENLKTQVRATLQQAGVSDAARLRVDQIIDRDAEVRNNIVEDISRTVAVYQGQATLGKIVNVILHEGRRPLSFFRNETKNLNYWQRTFTKTNDRTILVKMIEIVEGINGNAQFLVDLFGRLDPLAARRRTKRDTIIIKRLLQQSLKVFEEEFRKYSIDVTLICPDDFEITAWSQDLFIIFVNLIDNSVYWLKEQRDNQSKIQIDVVTDEHSLVRIDFKDNGPGIESTFISSGIIFEPEFTTKIHGTGLGLPIAGEAAARNALSLIALDSEDGAWFRLEPVLETDQ